MIVFGFVAFYLPLAIIAVLLALYFQDLGLKLILFFAAVWFAGYWLIPEMMDLSRDLVWVKPGETQIKLRTVFAGLEGAIALSMFLVIKVRNWVP